MGVAIFIYAVGNAHKPVSGIFARSVGKRLPNVNGLSASGKANADTLQAKAGPQL